MRFMVWLPIAANALLGLGLPVLDRRLPARAKPASLVGVGLVGAGCWLWCLGLLAAIFLDRWPWPVPATAGFRVAAGSPWSAGAAAVVAAILVVRVAVVGAAQLLGLVRGERIARLLPGGVVVVPEPAPGACAVGGLTRSRITITTGLRDCLTAAEREAVVAHEEAHLAGRHHLLRAVAACCSAASPLLWRLPGLVDRACERAADERAARSVGDRRTVARALSKAALAAIRYDRDGVAGAFGPGFHRDAVPDRVAALLDGTPTARRPAVLAGGAALALVVVMLVAAVHAGADCLALLG